ncbi:FAD:protein FMN transferase [Paeniglutamicibacter psychrophenolicus]|uniref:FAD:protein FMN transferase n=1 Tax=Paeniglutamicibacter psychrophenolicus TaxID=257454 RepID=UPI00278A88AE|nr:FAD:protein FMN transferase [Paeniglutamicibacter psychrophenolicus]MDQ0092385.1 thiamine biosynthesis lipoprotein [Paeniglutamicibacter psychrophenolicus]
MGGTASWPVWGLEASIAVEDPGMASDAERLVRGVIAQIDDACSRFRPDSELMRLQPELDSGADASPLLAALVRSALDAARWTGGDVDPTLGKDMESLGYDRDISRVRLGSAGSVTTLSRPRRRTPGWRQVDLEGQKLTVPRNLRLDLGATAKAVAADRAASLVFDEMGCGILVSLGGDIATAGPEPEGGWQVLVQDLPTDPWQQVTLGAGQAMATSSTQKRRWKHEGHDMHHILDPRFGLPAEPVWRSVTVAASTCLLANAYSTAGIVRGFAAVAWFERGGIAGRLVDRQGRIVTTGGWPREDDVLTGVDSHG